MVTSRPRRSAPANSARATLLAPRRGRRHRGECRRVSSLAHLRQGRFEGVGGQVRDGLTVHERGRDRWRRGRAVDRSTVALPSAVVSCQPQPRRPRISRWSLSEPMAWQASARHSFTSCGGGVGAEIVVEGDAAVHLGARQVQRVRDQRHGAGIHVAERLLQRVQDRQRGPLREGVFGDDPGCALRAPGRDAPWFPAQSVPVLMRREQKNAGWLQIAQSGRSTKDVCRAVTRPTAPRPTPANTLSEIHFLNRSGDGPHLRAAQHEFVPCNKLHPHKRHSIVSALSLSEQREPCTSATLARVPRHPGS